MSEVKTGAGSALATSKKVETSSIATIATSRAWSIDFIRYLRQYRQTNRKIDRNRRRINCACGLVSKCKKSIAHSQLISYTINMVCV